MEEQLDLAPAGYLIMDRNLRIVETNTTILAMTGLEKAPVHMHDLLTIASRVYFQTFFIPSILTHGAVNEMYLSLKTSAGPLPVLMNTNKRNGLFECVLMQMSIRNEYETELLNAKREAEKISQATGEANKKLTLLLEEVESKRVVLNVLNERLQELMVTDALTGLKNRRYLEEFMPKFLAEGTLSLLMMDIDFFKKINDTFGHHAGDVILQELAHVLEKSIGGSGFAARTGGEEFVVVLPGIELAEAETLAEQIRIEIEDHEWPYRPITVSIGVAQNSDNDWLSSLMERADAALYNSKNNGRNQVTLAS